MDFGSYARSAREARHLTFEDVSTQTKINRVFWIDLEANDLKRWPREEIYRRGFLRSYAAAIGLDADDVLARFAEQFAERPAAVVPDPAHDGSPLFGRKRPLPALPQLRQFSTNAVLPLLLIGMGAFAFQDRKALDATFRQKPAASVAGVAHTGQAERRAPAVAMVPAVGSPPAASARASEPAPVVPQQIPAAQGPAAQEMEGTLVVETNPSDAFITINGI